MPDLREIQHLFWRAIAAEPGASGSRPPDELLRLVLPGPRLAPAERVGIYAEMYFWRLVEVLREDFPRVAAVVGAGFERLAGDYLARHPSSHPSVRHLGRSFAGFLDARAVPALPAFLADLARLEWSRVEAFDAPDAASLRTPDVASLPPAEWPALRLAPVPALEILHTAWPVHRVWDGATVVAPEPTALRVWRDGFHVYHASMDALEASALRLVLDRTTFEAVCDLCEGAEQAAALLARWLEDGLLLRL